MHPSTRLEVKYSPIFFVWTADMVQTAPRVSTAESEITVIANTAPIVLCANTLRAIRSG
ncbi:hypothetical protein MB901379_03706 [Mycobacterium basiliense]|uniref:Uncharacterized protein n=1 Tax=Mycobacterium basiliense TaxID=2094119 RepID=A0A447GI34_9MYCO|nr:hypothetical protein MB901379_03706 [Mycobacterium basiliense]